MLRELWRRDATGVVEVQRGLPTLIDLVG